MTSVAVNTYTHSVTYVADNILKSMKDIIRLSGLDPDELRRRLGHANARRSGLGCIPATSRQWCSRSSIPRPDALIVRWDIDIVYSWSSAVTAASGPTPSSSNTRIRKAGLAPSEASYRLLLQTKPGRPDVDGLGHGDISLDGRHGPAEPRHRPSSTAASAATRPIWRKT